MKMNPIFIIGCSRTGSKLYASILKKSANVDMIEELQFRSPRWLRRDFVAKTKKSAGDLKDDRNITKLLDLMYSGDLAGAYWANIKLDKERLKHRILNSDRKYSTIFSILLDENAKMNEKETPGAKFPVHFSYLGLLLKWFPKSKIIYLTRDPHAMYASHARWYTNSQFPIVNSLKRLVVLFYVILSFNWSINTYKRYMTLDNILISKYEDLIQQPEDHMRELCSFLGIEFKKTMLDVKVRGSSYREYRNRLGFNKDSVSRWTKELSLFSKRVIEFFCKHNLTFLGYL